MRERTPSTPLPVLDAEQRRVVEHRGGPLLVLAGPGTGKTTTLVEAVAARIDEGVDAERILLLTFGRRAAAELRSRVTTRLGRTIREPLARTFHSYAFGVLRREAGRFGEPTPRLLAGPEQDLVVRELLRGDAGGVRGPGAVEWPAALRPALGTRGFAQEVRDLLLRCTERGVSPVDLDRMGRIHDRPEWRAAARFFQQYVAVSALAEVAAYDPSELVRAVVDRLAHPSDGLRKRERDAYDWIYVDEYQDTDPGQEALLRHLVPRGGNLVVVGDPDQAIYAFRGADVAALQSFPERFRTRTGAPAPVAVLSTCRRSAPAVVAAAAGVARRLGGIRPRPLVALPDRPPGRVDVLLAGSRAGEAALVATVLRRAHLVDGIPWTRMAVLVRSTAGRLSELRRALSMAHVPVAAAPSGGALADQPGVRPLLDLLRVVLRPTTLDEETAARLLTGPVGRLDPVGLRRLRREVRRRIPDVAGAPGPLATAISDQQLLDELLSDVPGRPPPGVRGPVLRVARAIGAGRRAAARGDATAETVLWALWQRTGLSARWRAGSLQGGPRAAGADRDLDAVLGLFEAVARFVDRLPEAGAEVFLDSLQAQQIPDESLTAGTSSGKGVAIRTAHAAKGLEWDLVVVAGLQEGVWPDLRARGSILGAETIADVLTTGDALPSASTSRRLQEERRLFYVAMTRAREQLVVTAVADSESGERPSRLLDELPLPEDDLCRVTSDGAAGSTTLGAMRRRLPVADLRAELQPLLADPEGPAATRARAAALIRELDALGAPLDLPALVAELRRAVADTGAPRGARQEAAGHLARLARAGVAGADPAQWYGVAPVSDPRPLRGSGETVVVSPSRVELFASCQLRWLLEHVGGTAADASGQTVGSLVHAVAALAADPRFRDEDLLRAELNRQWSDIDLGSPWFTAAERVRAEEMLRRFVDWLRHNDRKLLGVELDFVVDLDVASPEGPLVARLAGRVDRLERDDHGRGVVVDLKTGSTKPSDRDLPAHAQLGAYQLAVELGAFSAAGVGQAGGASLVQVGKAAGATSREQVQPPLDQSSEPGWATRLVSETAAGMAGSTFRAIENRHCDRCPVRSSCPLQEEGRQVVGA